MRRLGYRSGMESVVNYFKDEFVESLLNRMASPNAKCQQRPLVSFLETRFNM
ncbi:hypothetical protein [Enterococcus phage PEF9]